jgi:hypothetical protein
MTSRMKAVLVVRVLFLEVVVIRYDCAVIRNAERNTYIEKKLKNYWRCNSIYLNNKLVKRIHNISIYVAKNLVKFEHK